VIVGVAEHDLGRFGAFVIKLQAVFPGESDAAVNLRAAGADLSGGLGATGLGDRECDKPTRERRDFTIDGKIGRPGSSPGFFVAANVERGSWRG
jgi:hypothetical protein